jgi:hypothetical protein
MGGIFPMAPLATRLGLVKRREKEARRSVQQRHRDCVPSAEQGVHPLAAFLAQPAPLSPLQRHNRRRTREARQKAETRRLKGEMAVSIAVKDLLKAVGDSSAIIARLPRDEWGRVRVYDVTESGGETTSSRKTSSVFRRFTFEERRALSSTTGKYRTAAKRLSVSVTATSNLWEATLAEYKRLELIRSSAQPGGIL